MAVKNIAETYFAKLNIYTYMAHYVAKVLKQRPNDILDGWGVPELIVAFGQYTNEESYKNFLQWKNLSRESKKTAEKPDEYHVMFYAPEEGAEDGD